MTAKITYEMDQECICVPYDPVVDAIRNNRGFTDLRGRPELVCKIAEAQQSSALLRLLVALAQPSANAFSLGCDLGSHREENVPKRIRDVAGGYIWVACKEYSRKRPEEYRRLAEEIAGAMQNASSGHRWELIFVLKGVELHLDNYGDIIPALWIWFYACAANAAAAVRSREALIEGLNTAFRAATHADD